MRMGLSGMPSKKGEPLLIVTKLSIWCFEPPLAESQKEWTKRSPRCFLCFTHSSHLLRGTNNPKKWFLEEVEYVS